MTPRLSRSVLLVASALTLSAFGATSAFAQASDTQLSSIEKQIKALQAELAHMKKEAAERDAALKAAQAHAYAPPPAAVAPVMPQIPAGYALVPAAPGSAPGSVVLARTEAPPAPKLPLGAFKVGGVTVQLGGFVDFTTIARSRNENQDITSSFTSLIPEKNSQLYHEPEVRETVRASRLAGLVTANPDEVTKIAAYVETDFQGAGTTSNSNQSNSFVLRLRQAYSSYDRSDLGLEILAGQTWSLLTMTKQGTNPQQINLPTTIDAGYVPGFDYTRAPQIRIAKSFANGQYWLAASLENPQTTYAGNAPSITGATINQSNAQTSGIDTGVTNSNNFVPDVVVKATADYPMAHLEAYAVGSSYYDRVSVLGGGKNNSRYGGGVGAAALIHLVPKLLDVQASGLYGDGVGRYGTSQLADATYTTTGAPRPLPAYSALVGLVGHPTPKVDVFAYAGTEHVSAQYNNIITGSTAKVVGYGSPLLSNAGCEEELSTLTCTAATQGDAQGTVGGYYKFLKGPYGTMQVGLQYSYTRRFVFQGSGTSIFTQAETPKTDDNMLFFNFRWYPFQ